MCWCGQRMRWCVWCVEVCIKCVGVRCVDVGINLIKCVGVCGVLMCGLTLLACNVLLWVLNLLVCDMLMWVLWCVDMCNVLVCDALITCQLSNPQSRANSTSHLRRNELSERVQILLYADDMQLAWRSQPLRHQFWQPRPSLAPWHQANRKPKSSPLTAATLNRNHSSINLRGTNIETVESFTYLGRKFSSRPSLDEEIPAYKRHPTVSGASNTFSTAVKRLQPKPSARLQVNCISNAPRWCGDVARPEPFQMRCLRYILGIRFATHGKMPDHSIRTRCSVRPITDMLCTDTPLVGSPRPHEFLSTPPQGGLLRSRAQGSHFSNGRQHIINDFALINPCSPTQVIDRSGNE
jgi:hypothetical protein